MYISKEKVLEYQRLCKDVLNREIGLEDARIEALQLLKIVKILHGVKDAK